MTPTEATIALQEEISYSVVATYKDSGKPIPGAIITNLEWFSSQPIGDFIPGSNSSSIIFKPSVAGTTQISAKAVIRNVILI